MSEKEMASFVDDVSIIVDGYAFKKKDDSTIEIVNIEQLDHVMIINNIGEMIETNMDAVEQTLVLALSEKNLQFVEA